MEKANECSTVKGLKDIDVKCYAEDLNSRKPTISLYYNKITDKIIIELNQIEYEVNSDEVLEWMKGRNIVLDRNLDFENVIIEMIKDSKNK